MIHAHKLAKVGSGFYTKETNLYPEGNKWLLMWGSKHDWSRMIAYCDCL
jgi:hypothetical protein